MGRRPSCLRCDPGHPFQSHRAQPLNPQPGSPSLPPAHQGWHLSSPSGLGQWPWCTWDFQQGAGDWEPEGGTWACPLYSLSALFLLPSFCSVPSSQHPFPSHQHPSPSHACPLLGWKTLMHLDSHRISHSVEQRSGRGWPFPSFLF